MEDSKAIGNNKSFYRFSQAATQLARDKGTPGPRLKLSHTAQSRCRTYHSVYWMMGVPPSARRGSPARTEPARMRSALVMAPAL